MAHEERNHALLSASSAHRWLACTPSARLEEQFPDTASEAAKEGTLAHELAELKVRNYFKPHDVLWSSIFVTLMANKIGGLQFGIYRNCQISSRVFHTAVAALPLTKANRSDFE